MSQLFASGSQVIGASHISPTNEYSGLFSFRIDWFDFPAVQGTLKSLLQHHSSKASILQHSALFMVQLSHPYMANGKIIALTIWTFVNKAISLLFNILCWHALSFGIKAIVDNINRACLQLPTLPPLCLPHHPHSLPFTQSTLAPLASLLVIILTSEQALEFPCFGRTLPQVFPQMTFLFLSNLNQNSHSH